MNAALRRARRRHGRDGARTNRRAVRRPGRRERAAPGARDREHLGRHARRRQARGAPLGTGGRGAASRARHLQLLSVFRPALHPPRRRCALSLLRQPRLRLRPGGYPRLRRLGRSADGRVRSAGTGRRRRDHPMDRLAALVQRIGRHGGNLLERIQLAASGGAPAAGAQGHYHALLDGRPLRRRCALQGRLHPRGHVRLGDGVSRDSRAALGPRHHRTRRLAGVVAQAIERRAVQHRSLVRSPVSGRFLEARVGDRGLRAHPVPRLRHRRLGGRLQELDIPLAQGSEGSAQGARRTLDPHLSSPGRARAGHRLLERGAALVGPLVEGQGHRHHEGADAARVDAVRIRNAPQGRRARLLGSRGRLAIDAHRSAYLFPEWRVGARREFRRGGTRPSRSHSNGRRRRRQVVSIRRRRRGGSRHWNCRSISASTMPGR